MSFESTASHLGTSTNSIEQLLRGNASEGMANALGISSSAIQKFINGQSSDSIAEIVNISSAELQHLRNELDASGASGFILGLALANHK